MTDEEFEKTLIDSGFKYEKVAKGCGGIFINEVKIERLLIKAEGVKDCVKWMEEKIKVQNTRIKNAESLFKQLGHFDDCGESYRQDLTEERIRAKTLIEVKIGLEKYMKKLKHEAEETK